MVLHFVVFSNLHQSFRHDYTFIGFSVTFQRNHKKTTKIQEEHLNKF